MFKKTLTAIAILAISGTTIHATTFQDTNPEQYFYNHIEELVSWGSISDTHDNYRPFDDLTRAEASAIICKSALLTIPANIDPTPVFIDVPFSEWFYNAVDCLYINGIISGYNNISGNFGPHDPVTREQFAKMVVLAFDLSQYAPDIASFPDVNADTWSYTFIETAHQISAINGYQDGSFGPQNKITRADAAVIIWQTMNAQPTT